MSIVIVRHIVTNFGSPCSVYLHALHFEPCCSSTLFCFCSNVFSFISIQHSINPLNERQPTTCRRFYTLADFGFLFPPIVPILILVVGFWYNEKDTKYLHFGWWFLCQLYVIVVFFLLLHIVKSILFTVKVADVVILILICWKYK